MVEFVKRTDQKEKEMKYFAKIDRENSLVILRTPGQKNIVAVLREILGILLSKTKLSIIAFELASIKILNLNSK